MQSFGFVSKNPIMKNITDYLVDEGSYEEDVLLGIDVYLFCSSSMMSCIVS